ncbi:MAG: methyltransferase domain-containing protein [Acidobacteriia bacterium]|nr:methyltransferase domain-containing protein [Terriglobia bacterium]
MAASFRDPAGTLFSSGGRIFRIVNAQGTADLDAFLGSAAGRGLLESGSVAGTRMLGEGERQELLGDPGVQSLFDAVRGEMVVEHERIVFPSFPYEWPPEMLHAAGVHTLDLAQALLPDGLGLKDATPYNVLFRGPDPVFIDVLSFERRVAGDATWLPYAQFVRTFTLPLLANKYYGLALDQVLFARRDGLEPEEVYRWAGPLERLRPPFLSLVSLPAWLGRRQRQASAGIYQRKPLANAEKAAFILSTLLHGLRRTMEKLKPAAGRKSAWSDYMASNNNYSAEHHAAKKEFVAGALAEFHPKRVLDVGCNDGFFSALAARAGAGVVAIDYDPVMAGEVWLNASGEGLDILPLVVNLTRPTPGMGWRNRECASFLDRARGGFDAVLMLAVIHHMLVTERVPLAEIVDLAAELTTDLLVIEFIAPEDSMFQRLTRGREELHRGLTIAVFESCCRRRFDVVRSQHLEGSARWLYLMRIRGD